MSIEVQSVTKVFGLQKALDTVSFSIPKGEVVGLLGPNGAGKSTLMKILSCFIPPSSGKAMVYGLDVMENSMEVKKIVGYLPENNPLYLDMYVREYLEFIAGMYHISTRKNQVINQVVERTGLKPEQHKKIGALSKGYRQRTGLAQVLLHDPEVLILDEPTSGLDPNQLVEIRNLIAEIGKEKTVILSTHIMQEVEAICNRVIIIDQGKIVADAPTASLSQQTSSLQVILLELDQDVPEGLLQSIPGVNRVTDLKNHRWRLESGEDADIRPRIFQCAVDHQLTVLSMNREAHSLEKVFQQLTGKG